MGEQLIFDGSVLAPRKVKAPGPESVGGRLRTLMRDGVWRTLMELQRDLLATGCSAGEAAISARIRELRKLGDRVQARFREGSHAPEYSIGTIALVLMMLTQACAGALAPRVGICRAPVFAPIGDTQPIACELPSGSDTDVRCTYLVSRPGCPVARVVLANVGCEGWSVASETCEVLP